MVNPKTIFGIWATSLIFDKEIAYALVLCEKSQRDQFTGMGSVVTAASPSSRSASG